jgi:chromosomal replication initiation ATPase DnaA
LRPLIANSAPNLLANATPSSPEATANTRAPIQAVSNVWNERWEELVSARGTGARQTALFIGRIRGRLSLKELGRLAGGIHHNAVGIAIRRFTQRLQSDRTLLEKVALVQKELEPR